jgi:septin 3/9/12
MVHHNIRLYPFDTEDNDDEEVQLNDSIRVRN